MGALVDEIATYRTVTPEASYDLASEAFDNGIDIATFSSSSTVTNLLKLLERAYAGYNYT